ncbi:MAG: lysostaphin resistance A-like protein [Dermatophilaceae bacterium]
MSDIDSRAQRGDAADGRAQRGDAATAGERWDVLRRAAQPGLRGAILGLTVGAAPALAMLIFSPDPLKLTRETVGYWSVVLGASAPLFVVAWWASRRWRLRNDVSLRRACGWTVAAMASFLVFSLGAAVTEDFLEPLVGDATSERWDNWLSRGLFLWAVLAMLLLWRDITPQDVGLGRRLSTASKRWVVVMWALAASAAAALHFAGAGSADDRYDPFDTLLELPLNPLAEELFFRGLLLGLLVHALGERRWGVPGGWAVPVVALVFTFSHFVDVKGAWATLDVSSYFALAMTIIVAFVLWALYAVTGSIWPGVAYHALNNCLEFAVLQVPAMIVVVVVLVVAYRRRPLAEAAPDGQSI